MRGFFARLFCRHPRAGREALGSIMTGRGPYYRYRCGKCGSFFMERW